MLWRLSITGNHPNRLILWRHKVLFEVSLLPVQWLWLQDVLLRCLPSLRLATSSWFLISAGKIKGDTVPLV